MPTRRASSRVVKKEKSKMWRQTFLFVLVGVGVLLLFLFVILPASSKILDLFSDRSVSFDSNDDIPPQVPVFQSPVEATSSAMLAVRGYGEANSEVFLVINGKELPAIVVDDEGGFEKEIELSEGQNIVLAYSTDKAGNSSRESKEIMIVMDTEEPTIVLDNLASGQSIVGKQNKALTIKGLTEPKAKVTINDRFVFANADGAFSHSLQLNEGENEIKILVVDKAGNSSEQLLKINFQP